MFVNTNIYIPIIFKSLCKHFYFFIIINTIILGFISTNFYMCYIYIYFKLLGYAIYVTKILNFIFLILIILKALVVDSPIETLALFSFNFFF